MDFTVIIGIIIGLVAVLGGMAAKGTSPAVLINPAAFLIIIVGTIAAICNAFPKDELKRIPSLFKILVTDKKLDPIATIDKMVELAKQSRRDGLLSLQSAVDELEDPYLKKGMELILDGTDEQALRDYMETEIEMMEERHRAGALIFSQAGSYAPTLGVLGAVVGLIGALGDLQDMEKLGYSIAAAFVATLLGIFTGYVLWHPFANKLKRKSQEEVTLKTMILEGLIHIQRGSNPTLLRDKMTAFLPPYLRSQMSEEKREENIDG